MAKENNYRFKNTKLTIVGRKKQALGVKEKRGGQSRLEIRACQRELRKLETRSLDQKMNPFLGERWGGKEGGKCEKLRGWCKWEEKRK